MPNYTDDSDLQLGYDFIEYAKQNHWANLFIDRSEAVAAISDVDILNYVRTNNYQNANNDLILARQLQKVPTEWDFNNDGVWNGYIPDCYYNFDAEGFDRNTQGQYTGWRAFGYYPFLGTFWPTNGSTDDVLIRLPESFRLTQQGFYSREVYQLNFAIIEALIKQKDIAIPETNEALYGVDLNKNAQLDIATSIVYDWAPLEDRYMSYVGMAKLDLEAGTQHLSTGLFPIGTEFLHSVRYIDVTDTGKVQLAARMKELRYAKKTYWQNYGQLENFAANEFKEKHDFPDRIKQVLGDMEQGISTRLGWTYQGFIEDAEGHLRPQTYEEHVFCVACHSTVGAVTDTVYAFPRKFSTDTDAEGWYHWSQKDMVGTPEAQRKDGQGEYQFYLLQNGAGDEFRANTDVINQFFHSDGTPNTEAMQAMSQDISLLLFPSAARALQLNKAYRVIVQEQSFINGRDATITPPNNVHKSVTERQSTGIEQDLINRLK
ncbi:hypothetical protein [Candidatus Albibeggiatoa sp. nov. BB20]|uniref:hypothetical protein n=1 Tax=Candidatus Albibeggiatoa sp. nov. BB20 TaxID=3162723 RepID=UPI003365558E